MPAVQDKEKKKTIGEMSQGNGMKANGIRTKNGKMMVAKARPKAEVRLWSLLRRRVPNRHPRLNLAGELARTMVVCARICIAFATRSTTAMTSTWIRSSSLVCRVSPCGC